MNNPATPPSLFQKCRVWLTSASFGKLINVSLILVLGFSLTVLMTLHMDELPKAMSVGSVALKDIKSDQNYEIVDEQATNRMRAEAASLVAPVYDYDAGVENDVAKRVHEAFETSRNFLDEKAPVDAARGLLGEEVEAELKRLFQEVLGVMLSEEDYRILRSSRFHPLFERAITLMVHEALQYPVIYSLSGLQYSPERGYVLRTLGQGVTSDEVMHDSGLISDLSRARRRIEEINPLTLAHDLGLDLFEAEAFASVKSLAQMLVRANVNYNSIETEARRSRAEANIKDIVIKVKRGETIIQSGENFDVWHLTVIDGIRKARLATNHYLQFFGTFLFVNLILFLVYYYATTYVRKFRPTRKDLVFLGLTLCLFIAFLRIGVFLAATSRGAIPVLLGENTLYYLVPMAAGAMLVRFILNSQTAFIFSVVLSLLAGIYLENNLEMTVYYLMSGIFGAHMLANADRRAAVLLSGGATGLFSALVVVSLNMLSLLSVNNNLDPGVSLLNAASAFLGGILSSMVVLVLAPVMEALFDYTTDIKLLELGNLNHPLLKEMIVRTPGTYHHSQIVGILAEAGARSIGANALLARVGSYYHDIGKMAKSQYFIENQQAENPHDKLNPSMSALIIEAHVRDGLEMARYYKLPQKIADMIPQHQGTKLIGYFYNKALKTSDPALGAVEEKDYRYPGPKPQSREAGLIMMADTIEAAVRAMPDKSPNKIQATVERLVNDHFVDEQLDECDLTLRDLHLITQAFVDILNGMYHQRVEYPGIHPEAKAANGRSDDHSPSKRVSAPSNIAHLFRKKDQKNS